MDKSNKKIKLYPFQYLHNNTKKDLKQTYQKTYTPGQTHTLTFKTFNK